MPESRRYARHYLIPMILLVGVLWAALAQGQNYTAAPPTRELPTRSARITQTRSEANGRTLETRVIEVPSINGGYVLLSATERETVQQDSNKVRMVERLFVPDADGRRQLYQVTQAETTTLPEGGKKTVRTISYADLDGRLQTVRSDIEETVPMSASTKQNDDQVRAPR